MSLTVPTQPAVVVEQAPVVEFKPKAAPSKLSRKVVPSDWNIRPGEGEMITATHVVTGEIFEGEISEFNTFLKG